MGGTNWPHFPLLATATRRGNIVFGYISFGLGSGRCWSTFWSRFEVALEDLSRNFMEFGSHLKSLLQFQLASDTSSVTNLPYCLSTLTAECLLPSAHLAKWTTRISSLMYSREPGARWAGLCLAHRTSLLSQAIMIDCAQSWLVVALPALSVREYIPFHYWISFACP